MKKIIASIAVLAAMAMAVPAMASDAPGYGLTVGGRVKADMGWQILGDDTVGMGRNNTTDDSLANFFMTVNSNSYLRALFTSADKTTGVHLEFGMGSAINIDNNNNNGFDNFANTRFAYGWWKVGSCKLLVGQFAGRLGDRWLPNSNLGHTKSYKSNLNGFGFIGGTRNPKVALQMDVNDNFGFEVAIGQAGAETSTDLTGVGSRNSYLPRLEVVLDFKFGDFIITPGAGISYQEYKYNDAFEAANPELDDKVLSYLFWIPVVYQNGPFKVMVNGFYGQNMDTDWTGEWGNTNNWGAALGTGGRRTFQFGGQPAALPTIGANGDWEDTKSWGVGASVDYAFTDQLTVSVGGGVVNSSNDAWEGLNPDNRDDYTRWAAYVSMPYKVTSNFTIAPELAYYNYGDRVAYAAGGNDKAGDEWLLGIHFQFLF